jgi:hypothetical protein
MIMDIKEWHRIVGRSDALPYEGEPYLQIEATLKCRICGATRSLATPQYSLRFSRGVISGQMVRRSLDDVLITIRGLVVTVMNQTLHCDACGTASRPPKIDSDRLRTSLGSEVTAGWAESQMVALPENVSFREQLEQAIERSGSRHLSFTPW